MLNKSFIVNKQKRSDSSIFINKILCVYQLFEKMGVTNTGARNSVGLHHSVWHGHLPPHTHISYEGVFNELRYNVGPKTDKILDLHHAYARFQFA